MRDPLGVMWGKSNAAGRMHLLIAHLLDTAAVGEVMWDGYLSPVLKRAIDGCCDGRGRDLFALLCALHDVGKATPAFQSKDDVLAAVVRSAGFDIGVTKHESRSWHHTLAGAKIVKVGLSAAGWSGDAQEWIWPADRGASRPCTRGQCPPAEPSPARPWAMAGRSAELRRAGGDRAGARPCSVRYRSAAPACDAARCFRPDRDG